VLESLSFRSGEVFPEGGEIERLAVLNHAKPKDAKQAAVWKKLAENTLKPPDTWEVALSAGKDKHENFEWLLPHRRASVESAQRGNSLGLFFCGD